MFSENYFMNTFRVSNSLDPNQALSIVGTDLGPNCFKGYQLKTLEGEDTLILN